MLPWRCLSVRPDWPGGQEHLGLQMRRVNKRRGEKKQHAGGEDFTWTFVKVQTIPSRYLLVM